MSRTATSSSGRCVPACSDTGSRRDDPRRRRANSYGARSGGSTSSPRRAVAPAGVARVVEPEPQSTRPDLRRGPRRRRRPRSRPESSRRQSRRPQHAIARRRARARRSGRAGRERDCRERRLAAASGRLPPAALASSTSNRPSVASPAASEGGCDSGEEVRAGAVPGQAMPSPRISRGHRGRGGLAVRGGDERDAVRESRSERVDGCRVELPEHLARAASCRLRVRAARESAADRTRERSSRGVELGVPFAVRA